MTLVRPKRYKHWQVRVRVPGKLQDHVGKKELWASTGTPDKEVATRRARAIYDKFDRQLDAARAARAQVSIEGVSTDQLVQIAQGIFQATMAEYSEDIILRRDLEWLDHVMDFYTDWIRFGGTFGNALFDETKEALARHGIEVADYDHPRFHDAVTFLCRAKASAMVTAMHHAEGDFEYKHSDVVVATSPDGGDGAPTLHGIVTVKDLVARHANDPSRANVSAAVKLQYEPSYRLLLETVGETTPVDQVTTVYVTAGQTHAATPRSPTACGSKQVDGAPTEASAPATALVSTSQWWLRNCPRSSHFLRGSSRN